MTKIKVTKEDFLMRFNASRKRKQKLLETLRQEILREHEQSTGFAATNIFVM